MGDFQNKQLDARRHILESDWASWVAFSTELLFHNWITEFRAKLREGLDR